MSTEEKREDSGFTVRDRRSLSEEPPAPEAEEATPETPEPPAAEPGPDPSRQALPEIDFTTFIASLSTSAMLHLGLIPDPDTKQPQVNLPLAKQTIDILGMLQAKTQGNLEENEATVLQRLLYDLRMRYLEASRAAG